MATRKANAVWQGNLKNGEGKMQTESGKLDSGFNAKTRFEGEKGTNPEELIGAAYAGCFSMALSNILDEAGYNPEKIETSAQVHLEPVDGGFQIKLIELDMQGQVPQINEEEFEKYANEAKENCPVSQVLMGARKELKIRLHN